MADAGADMYTFHYEATENPKECIRKIREAGMKVRSSLKSEKVRIQHELILDECIWFFCNGGT